MANKGLSFQWVEKSGTTEKCGADERVLRINDSREVVGFGVADEKGREHGAVIRRYEHDLVPFEFDPKTPWRTQGMSLPVGHYFLVVVTAARGGKAFGASQSENWFATAEDREVYITERVARMRKARKA